MSSDLTFLFSAHNKTNIKDWDSFLKNIFKKTMTVTIIDGDDFVNFSINNEYTLTVSKHSLAETLQLITIYSSEGNDGVFEKINTLVQKGGRRKTRKHKKARRTRKKFKRILKGGSRTSKIVLLLLFYIVFANVFSINFNFNRDRNLTIEELQEDVLNMFKTQSISDILNKYEVENLLKNVETTNLEISDAGTTAIQSLTLSNEQIESGESPTHQENYSPDSNTRDKTIFAEVQLGGASKDLLEIATNMKTIPQSFISMQKAKGVIVNGQWSRVDGNIQIENLFNAIRNDDEIDRDGRFAILPENTDDRLLTIIRMSAQQQLETMYNLNMLRDVTEDSGEFTIVLSELQVLPFGINPFRSTQTFHQDGTHLGEPIDAETDALKRLKRINKGYQCNACGGPSMHNNLLLTLMYEIGAETAEWRHIMEDENGLEIITPTNVPNSGNAAMGLQDKDMQHGARTSGVHKQRRMVLFAYTEDRKNFKPHPYLKRQEIWKAG